MSTFVQQVEQAMNMMFDSPISAIEKQEIERQLQSLKDGPIPQGSFYVS